MYRRTDKPNRYQNEQNETTRKSNRKPQEKSNRQIWDFGGSKHVYSLKAYYQDSENGFDDDDDDDYDVSALRIGT